jgi:nicotinamidase-related amidase
MGGVDFRLMEEIMSLSRSLIEVDDSILIVVDVQQVFLDKLPEEESAGLVTRIGWLVGVATRLGVPLVVTAEDIHHSGSVVPAIAQRLPPGTPIYDKRTFGLAANPEIRAAVKGSGRETAILVGLETDVCIAYSAIGLLQLGYQVAVVADGTASPGTGHAFGLERMRGAGTVITSVKGLYYEWMRTVEGEKRFAEQYEQELGDPGVEL